MFRARSHSRSGFTLVQLLVVLIVLALLFALLLPATQVLRIASSQASALNNLKQMGLALHGITGAYDSKAPPSVGKFPGPGGYNSTFWFHILPYIEQDNVYKNAIVKTAPGGDISTKLDTPVLVYRSPADATNPGKTNQISYASNLSVFGNMTRNYIAILNQKGLSNTIIVVERSSINEGKDKVATMTWPDTRELITHISGPKSVLYTFPEGKEPTAGPIDAAHCLHRTGAALLMGDGWAFVTSRKPTTLQNFAIAMDAASNKAPMGDW